MINTADEREEAKEVILNDLERSEILARNISPQYNLGKNKDKQTCFKTNLNAELQREAENSKSNFRSATATSKLKTVKCQQQMQNINVGYHNCMVVPIAHRLLEIFMYTTKVQKF